MSFLTPEQSRYFGELERLGFVMAMERDGEIPTIQEILERYGQPVPVEVIDAIADDVIMTIGVDCGFIGLV